MSAAIVAAQQRRSCLLASTFFVPILSLGISAAEAQQSASPSPLPPIEISSPGDENRTRAKPVTDEGSGVRRVAPRVAQPANTNVAPGGGPSTAQTSNAPAVRQFNGIVGAA